MKQVTLPRLELCACHLLTQLLVKVKTALKFENIDTFGWTDSTIVLSWLSSHPRKWKNFVANRTSYIIDILPSQYWHHIPSKSNPADLATRGVSPIDLKNAHLWWYGPTVIREEFCTNAKSQIIELTDLERRSKEIYYVNEKMQNDLFYYYSDYTKLIRITALILRFVRNCKAQNQIRQTGFLTGFILHKDNVFTKLIVRYYHLQFLHAGSRQLQYLLGIKYWIPSVVHIIKQCVYKCVICMRHRNKPFEQQMGNLPKYRLESVTAFQNAGVDFAGPVLMRSWKGRGSKNYKSWISVFICLTTKAMHLELVTDLSTDAFIASLRRFVARRGKPSHMFSDNGTNFVGCNQKLKELLQFMLSSSIQEAIIKETY